MDKKYIEDLAENIADFFEKKELNLTPYGEGVQDGLLVFSCLLKKENGYKGESIKEDNKTFVKMLRP